MAGHASPRILVLDDDTMMLALLSRKLGDHGFASVTVCTDGHDALRRLDPPDGPPDLILCDLDASLGLARQLGMAVVAEGVEDRDDWDLLRATGCEFAQGYFVGMPMPGEDLPGWIEGWQAKPTGR